MRSLVLIFIFLLSQGSILSAQNTGSDQLENLSKYQDRFYRIQPFTQQSLDWGKQSMASLIEADFGLVQKGRKIYLKYPEAKTMEEMFSDRWDGIAVDVVFKDQFPCTSENLLHPHYAHDGILLRPRYRFWLKFWNRRRKKKDFYVKVGKLPKDIEGDFQLNTVLVHEKKFAAYYWKLFVPAGDILPGNLAYEADLLAWADLFGADKWYLDFEIPFEKNNYEFSQEDVQPMLDSIASAGRKVKKIKIQAYASVEGPVEKNQMLQERRAWNLFQAIQKELPYRVSLRKSAKENWKGFARDIYKTEFSWLADMNRQEVKDTLASDVDLLEALEPKLGPHRYGKVRIYLLEDTLRNFSSNDLQYAISDYIKRGKPDSAYFFQSELYRRAILDPSLETMILNPKFPLGANWMPLVYNQFVVHKRQFPFDKEYLVRKYGSKVYGSSHSYTPMRVQRLEYIVHRASRFPEKRILTAKLESQIVNLKGLEVEEGKIRVLLLNYHLAGVARQHHIRKQFAKEYHLRKVADLYLGVSQDSELAHKLALYFNKYQRSFWALELLHPFMEKGEYDDNMLFTYTILRIRYEDYQDDFEHWIQEAKNRDPSRFCQLVSKQWQTKRNETVKSAYCKYCEEVTALKP